MVSWNKNTRMETLLINVLTMLLCHNREMVTFVTLRLPRRSRTCSTWWSSGPRLHRKVWVSRLCHLHHALPLEPWSHLFSPFAGVMPKHGLDVGACEVFRFYKLITMKGLIEPISMIVPRRVSEGVKVIRWFGFALSLDSFQCLCRFLLLLSGKEIWFKVLSAAFVSSCQR